MMFSSDERTKYLSLNLSQKHYLFIVIQVLLYISGTQSHMMLKNMSYIQMQEGSASSTLVVSTLVVFCVILVPKVTDQVNRLP